VVPEGRPEMHLTRNDIRATIFVGAAIVTYWLWQSGTAFTGTSTRVLAVAVFALGWLGCTSDTKRMAAIFTPGAVGRPSTTYIVVASMVGAIALVSGIWAIVAASETALAILISSMAILWVMTTISHETSEDRIPMSV
jgi:hypothetical protein